MSSFFTYLAFCMKTKDLSNREESAAFYEQRYSRGYMGHWSDFEKEKLLKLIKELNLGPTGKALDFGCGRGIFTAVFQEALPGWEIYGCDISPEAISFASKNNASIHFFVLGDKKFADERFDFIHSHHVLEHTFDEKVSASEMCGFAAESCTMIHSLPCDHEGSLEYKIASATKGGIDPKTGKFFFEDPAHMRRLSSTQTIALFEKDGFRCWKEFYANQYYGALKWIAESQFGLVLKIANPWRAKDLSSFLFLMGLLGRLKFYWFCSFAASAFEPADKGRLYRTKRTLQAICFILFFWIAIPVKSWLLRKANEEWDLHRTDKNGSDLFLVLKRG